MQIDIIYFMLIIRLYHIYAKNKGDVCVCVCVCVCVYDQSVDTDNKGRGSCCG